MRFASVVASIVLVATGAGSALAADPPQVAKSLAPRTATAGGAPAATTPARP